MKEHISKINDGYSVFQYYITCRLQYKAEDGFVERYIITKEEFDYFYSWENDMEKINEIKTRVIGCDLCNMTAKYGVLQNKESFEELGNSPETYCTLYQCKKCGTYYEMSEIGRAHV